MRPRPDPIHCVESCIPLESQGMSGIKSMVFGVLMATQASFGGWFFTAEEVGLAAELVGINLVPASEVGANRTYRLWAVMPSNWQLAAVAGNLERGLEFSTDGAFYQHDMGGNTSTAINSAIFTLAPELEWDSYLTIGMFDHGSTQDPNTLLNIGFNWSSFEAGGDLFAENGACWVLPNDPQGYATAFTDGCQRQGVGVCIGQFTLLGEGATMTGSILLQGLDETGATWQRRINDFSVDADGVSDALPPVVCAADLDSNGQVDVHDLLNLLSAWSVGSCADISGDARMDSEDFYFLISKWGACSPG